MRLIDADALKKDLELYAPWIDVSPTIDAQPTIEAEPVVRCKDCKWWDKKDDSPYGYCHACKHGHRSEHWEISIYRTYKGDWYCADGERKEDDATD
jgi:hypothetical protein